jgi:Ricin-type beta-trefoil lectin domain
LSAANSNSSTSNKITSSQSSENKKVLKKKLSLGYTNPKFETDLSNEQKDAILTSLKKWKGELPINNAFTVTSIASLKTETSDTKSKVKKSKKETPNAQVVYMWAKSANPNWPASRIPTSEESEEGDQRFIFTEFNVLLKQTKNGKYKASIERDVEVKTESIEISESIGDDKIYQDLFGTNLADNALTATTDILIESQDSGIPSVSSESSSSNIAVSSVIFNISTLSSQSTVSNQISPTASISSVISIPSNISVSSKKISLIESLLSFGAVKASAGEYDFSFPWKNGDTWNTTQYWHECNAVYANNYPYPTTETTYGCALDLIPANGASDQVLSPVSGTVKRICNDPSQSKFKIGNMTIYHIASNTALNIGSSGTTLKKSDYLGKMFYPPSSPRDANNNFVTDCGTTDGYHIHMKLNGINSGSGSFSFSNATLYGNTNYVSLTSDNTPPVANPITDPNITSVQPAQINYNKVMDGGCLTADNSRVYMYDRFGNDCQKMRYQPSNNTITNPYGKCLDGGDVYNNASNRWIRYSTCNNGNNQKWKQDDGGRIWSLQKNSSNNSMCIEHYSTDNSTGLDANPCNNNQGQKWYFDLGVTREAAPAGATIVDSGITNVQPPQANWAWAMDNRCGTAENTQVVMKARDNGNCQKMRYNTNNTITNPYGKCLDAGDINNTSNKWIRFSTCNNGNNQKWKQDNGGRIWSLAKNNANQTVCIEYESLADQYGMNANVCNGNQNQKWYFDIGITKEEVPTTSVPTTNYKLIKSYTNGGYGFNIYGGGDGNQTPIKLWTLSGSNNELFSFEASGEIKNKISNKCVDAGDINSSTNRWLRIETCHGGSNQKFYQDGGFRIHSNANSNLCVDSAVLNSQGSTIYMYPCTNGDNQKWQLN